MKHLGDITKIHGYEIEPVDIITGGSPCQDLSVAGKRAGLAGERSGLFMEQIRIIKEMREHDRNIGRSGGFIRPRYMVWENVPGTFSSNKGEDFRAVLEETVRVVEPNANVPEPPKEGWHKSGAIVGNGWSIAWRLHDAQYWGVPQRRKRLCLLADFNGSTAPDILFDAQLLRDAENSESYKTLTDNRGESEPEIQPECESLSGDSEQSEETGEGVAERIGRSIDVSSFQERAGKPGGGKGILIQNEMTSALSTAGNQKVLTRDEPIVIHDKATRYRGGGAGRHDDGGGNGLGIGINQPSPAVSTSERHAISYGIEPGAAQRMNPENRISEELSPTLRSNAGDNQAAVAITDENNK